MESSYRRSPIFYLGEKEALELDGIQYSAENGTVLRRGNQLILRTPEHLIAALLGISGNFFFEVHITGKELPGLDGSALPWRQLLLQCLESGNFFYGREWTQYTSQLQGKEKIPGGFFSYRPSSHFEVEYTYQRGDWQETYHFSTVGDSSAAQYDRNILSARTFITWKSFQSLEQSLLKGITVESGLLVAENQLEYSLTRAGMISGEFPFIHKPTDRGTAELARHKILDLMGDLGLLDFQLPRLQISARNSGHHQNQQLLRKLIHERIRSKIPSLTKS